MPASQHPSNPASQEASQFLEAMRTIIAVPKEKVLEPEKSKKGARPAAKRAGSR